MTSDEIFKVITKLVGSVRPVGDASVDHERAANMKTFIEVFDKMHDVIDETAYDFKDSRYASERNIGQMCMTHLNKCFESDEK